MKSIACFIFIFQLCMCNAVVSNRTVHRTNQPNWEIEPKQYECYLYATELLDNITCTFKKLSRLRASYSFDAYIKPGIQLNGVMVKGTTYRKGTNLEYRQYGPKDMTFDLCGFLAGKWTNWMLEMVIDEFKKAGNVMHPCPFSGHIYIHNVHSTEDTYAILKLLPDGEYYQEGKVYENIHGKEKLMFKTKLFINVIAKGIFRF